MIVLEWQLKEDQPWRWHKERTRRSTWIWIAVFSAVRSMVACSAKTKTPMSILLSNGWMDEKERLRRSSRWTLFLCEVPVMLAERNFVDGRKESFLVLLERAAWRREIDLLFIDEMRNNWSRTHCRQVFVQTEDSLVASLMQSDEEGKERRNNC